VSAVSVLAVRFPCCDPGSSFTLEGALHLPPGGARAAAGSAVVCHPHPAFNGTMDVPLVVALAEALAAAGVVALRFNFRGIGGSGGEPTGGRAEAADVLAALAFLRARAAGEHGAPPGAAGGAGAAPLLLVGYSSGR